MSRSVRVTSYEIAGYDKQTERLQVRHRLSTSLVVAARDIAGVDENDDGVGSYPLEPSAAVALGLRMNQPLNPDLYDWFLEPAG